MIDKNSKMQKLALLLKNSEELKQSLEAERDESLKSIRFAGEEELLAQYYKKTLTSVYRIRNNAAALLLRNYCTCTVSAADSTLSLYIDDSIYEFTEVVIKNILQTEYDRIISKNKTDNPNIIQLLEKEDNNRNSHDCKDAVDKIQLLSEKKVANTNTDVMKSENETEHDLKMKTTASKEDICHIDAAQKEKVESQTKVEPKLKVEGKTETELKNTETEAKKQKQESYTETVPPMIKSQEKKPAAILIPEEEDFFFNFKGEENPELVFDFQELEPELEKEEKIEVEVKTGAGAEIDAEIDAVIETETIAVEKEHKEKSKEKETQKFKNIGLFTPKTLLPKEDAIAMPEVLEEKKEKVLSEKETHGNIKIKALIQEEPEVITPESRNPIFSSETIDLDPEEILKRLQESKTERDKQEMEQKILDLSKNSTEGVAFDLSTGKQIDNRINVEDENHKTKRIAEGIISASKKDMIIDQKIETNFKSEKKEQYRVQTESDYERSQNEFLYDKCSINIDFTDDQGKLIKTESAELFIFPLKIPESGTSMTTDICAYLKTEEEEHISSVNPGGKTTIVIKSEEYAVFAKGSWSNGNFTTAVSVLGIGLNANATITKEQVRPENIKRSGIGHNVLYLDHATTVHAIPIYRENNLLGGEYVDFIAVVIRDYGIDQDCESLQTKDSIEMRIKGEKYRYILSGKWDDKSFRLDLSTK